MPLELDETVPQSTTRESRGTKCYLQRTLHVLRKHVLLFRIVTFGTHEFGYGYECMFAFRVVACFQLSDCHHNHYWLLSTRVPLLFGGRVTTRMKFPGLPVKRGMSLFRAISAGRMKT